MRSTVYIFLIINLLITNTKAQPSNENSINMKNIENLPPYLTQQTKIENEISITGKWVPNKKGGIFRTSADSKGMIEEWENIHSSAKKHEGMLSTEINHAVGQDAVLVHHVFRNENDLIRYFETTATQHQIALKNVAKPEFHLVRGTNLSSKLRSAITAKNVPGDFGEYLFGYVKNDYHRPDPENAIQVTAKWTCKTDDDKQLEQLIHWWQQVGTDAFNMEKGLVRFEVYQVIGENALIIHETFDTSDELKFHLTKGTAAKYKKEIDLVAAPECYFFRGPVSWSIRTYSKFMGLPATYSSQGSHFSQTGGNMSDGTF
jgi:quinol monooxygenase YgiN